MNEPSKPETLLLRDFLANAGAQRLFGPLNLSAASGECVAVLGPNGSGKSSLLRAICAFWGESDRVKVSGRCSIAGEYPAEVSAHRRARLVAYVRDEISSDFPIPVREVLTLAGRFGGTTSVDASIVRDADLGELLDRDLRDLSGGERQRVLLAMTWLQNPRLLGLDETLSQLDLHHLWSVGAAVRRRARAAGAAVLLVTHEWNFAAQWADRILVLHQGQLIAQGTPAEVLHSDLLQRIYPGWPAALGAGLRPQLIYPGMGE